MRRTFEFGLALGLILSLASDRPGGQGRPAPDPLSSLGAIFQGTGGATRDTNSDGIPDAVIARIIVPAAATSEDAQSAVNIAARLGYETMAMTLPIVLIDADVKDAAGIVLPILIGRENTFVKQLAERGAIDLKPLSAGQGLVAVVRSPLGGGDGVVVVGGDDAGTLTAANELAARLPRLWAMAGIAISGVEQQTLRYLSGRGLVVPTAAVAAVVVDRERRGLASATVRVPVPSAAAPRAVRLLEDLDVAHRQGLEPRTLNFANVAATAVEVVADGRVAGRVSVRRSGLNARTLTPPLDPEEEAAMTAAAQGERPAGEPSGAPPAGQVAAKPPADAMSGIAQAKSATAAPQPTPTAGPAAVGAAPAGAAAAPPTPKIFDLSRVYTIDGWFGDQVADLIPDRLETTMILGEGPESVGAANIAARLGLESTGVTLPIAKPDEKVRDAARETNPILVGRTNKFVQQLATVGKTRLGDLAPGDGVVHIVPRAFGAITSTVVAGADRAGTDAAALYLARRVPYLWDNTRGAASYQDLTTDATQFFQARSGAGQAAMLLGELKSILDDLKGKTLQSIDAKLFVDKVDPRLDGYVDEAIKTTVKGAATKVSSYRMTDGIPVFGDHVDLTWEVDEFWTRFRADVLPKVRPGSKVDVELRVSESPEVRRQVADQVRTELMKAGTAAPRVRVLSAYKQGYFWLTEEIIPALKGTGVKSVLVRVAELHPDLDKKYKFYQVPTRWAHELYPIDEIFARDLAVPREAFRIQLVDQPKDVYEIEAFDGRGRSLLKAAFSPKFVEREYLDKFPGWSKVDVTTGWLNASVDGQVVADVRIKTDPERFWDYYQGIVLFNIYDNVMYLTGNRPTTDKQPFFRDLNVEIWMSEPDFRIGVDEEQISSLEALHEDIYFVSLDFFSALGRVVSRQRLASPGKIMPIIHPARPGKPGEASVSYAANAAARPKLEISYTEKGAERPVRVTRELARIDTTAPVPIRAVVRPDRVKEIELQIEPKDDREARRAVDALDALVQVQAAGLYRTTLSFEHVDHIAVNVVLKDGGTRRVVPNTGTAAPSNVIPAPAAKPPHPVVVWDHIIGPDESEDIVRKLAAYPEIKAYKAGKSYRERDISVMEITLPTSSELVSLAKATLFKPTIYLAGRQHANEVTSTSHTLRLAELLATEPAYKAILKKVNVIVQPVENPDGAAMAYELQKLTPTHMLHAGRYSSLGSDVGSSTAGEFPLPESLVRGRIWRDWLPDIYLNLHGYPSHEWVQPFAGYVPPGFRAYLVSRGWYVMLSGLRDPRYPSYGQFTDAIRDAVAREINKDADVRAMNLRHQERYRRWAFGLEPHVNTEEIFKDTMIYYSNPETGEPAGSRRAPAPTAPRPGSRPSIGSWPMVTYLNSGASETPDETAQGSWFPLVTKPGLAFVMANINYLRDGRSEVQHLDEDAGTDGVSLAMLRVRPVMPATGGGRK